MSTISKLVSYFEAIQEYLSNQDTLNNGVLQSNIVVKDCEPSEPALLRAPHPRRFRTPSFTSFPQNLIQPNNDIETGVEAREEDDIEQSEREDETFDALTCKAVDATEDEDCHSEISASQTPPNIGTHPGIQS